MGTLPVFYIYSLRELILDLEIKKKKILKEIKWFILGHLATNWQRWYLIPIPKIPKLCFSNYALVCLHIQSKKKRSCFYKEVIDQFCILTSFPCFPEVLIAKL